MGTILNYVPFMGQGLNTASNIISTAMTNRANRKMADTEWKRNIEMWKMNNRYNSPSMQMARFKEAGLNPNLMYGNGTPGNSSSAPQYHAPRQDYNFGQVQMGEALGNYIDLQTKGQQLVNMKEQNRSLKIANDTSDLKLRILEKWGMLKEQFNTRYADYRWMSENWRSSNLAYENALWADTYDDRKEVYRQNALRSGFQTDLTQSTYLNTLLDNQIKEFIRDIKGKESEFYNKGGFWFNPILRLLGIVR